MKVQAVSCLKKVWCGEVLHLDSIGLTLGMIFKSLMQVFHMAFVGDKSDDTTSKGDFLKEVDSAMTNMASEIEPRLKDDFAPGLPRFKAELKLEIEKFDTLWVAFEVWMIFFGWISIGEKRVSNGKTKHF